jgi:N-acetylneuraminic acid mutarotase
MQTSRVFHAACAAADMIYVFGGQRVGGGSGIDSVEAYDPASDTWGSRASIPTARLGMMASAVDDKCYLIGGADGPGGAALNRVDEYDPINDRWRRRADIPTARVAGASAVLAGKIYVAGGWTAGDIRSAAVSSLEVYDPVSNTWTSGRNMPTARAPKRYSLSVEAVRPWGRWIWPWLRATTRRRTPGSASRTCRRPVEP